MAHPLARRRNTVNSASLYDPQTYVLGQGSIDCRRMFNQLCDLYQRPSRAAVIMENDPSNSGELNTSSSIGRGSQMTQKKELDRYFILCYSCVISLLRLCHLLISKRSRDNRNSFY